MKIIHLPFCFYPDPVGGTEVYVASLSRLLYEDHGVEVVVAAPGEKTCEYKHDGLRVRRFAVSPDVTDVSELYGEGDEFAAREFEKILDEEQPDLVHLHAFTRGVSLKVLRSAKARGVPVVFTYHTPTVTCTRGTMMKWGSVPSDGAMLGRRCTACTLHGLGVNRVTAEITSSIPRPVRNLLAKTRRSGGVWTALRMRELVEKRHDATRAFLAEVDHIIAVCEWVRDVLLRNGVPENKITLSRQGIETRGQKSEVSGQLPERFTRERPLRLVYFGRLDPTKGVHVLIEAVRLDDSLPVTLDIYGTAQAESGAVYAARLTKLAGNDPRVGFCSPVPANQVVGTLSQYHMLAVPSQWLETGPLVVLEAFAAGVPVLGSNLGGIAELVDDRVNGLLIRSFGTKDWYSALKRIVDNPKLLKDWAKNLGTPRTMDQVAAEMVELYRQFIKREEAISHA